MSNLSYCRFRNTLNDLQDCAQALEDNLDIIAEPPAPLDDDEGDIDIETELNILSAEEHRAAAMLVKVAFDIVQLIVDASGTQIDEVDGEDLKKLAKAVLKARKD